MISSLWKQSEHPVVARQPCKFFFAGFLKPANGKIFQAAETKRPREATGAPLVLYTNRQLFPGHSKKTEQMDEQIKYIQKQRYRCTDIIFGAVTTYYVGRVI